ncbi:MAG: DUF373 family protein [Methanocalculaceae archaeon]|jgi:putative membrane protein|nr:DUF373 family protein [Methanocalculaceae archaeon]
MTTERTLILNIDRDDDVGYKAGVISPIVGREACLDTAMRLGIADPEESDTNAIFQAIKTYDDLHSKGEDVEIAVIGGNHVNMLRGDRLVAEHLKSVIAETGVTKCILISDGAEDEFVLPIIQSHLEVSGVERVVIKQLPGIEGTYYIIKKLLNDPKIARSVLVPIALAMILYAAVALLIEEIPAIVVMIGTLGVYFLMKGFGLEEELGSIYHGLVDSFHKGKISFVIYIVAAILAVCSVPAGLMSVIINYPISGDAGLLYNVMTFLYGSVIWLAVAGLLAVGGRIVDCVQNALEVLAQTIVMLFLVAAVGMIVYGMVIYFLSLSWAEPVLFNTVQGIAALILLLLAGFVTAFAGVHYQPQVQRCVLSWIDREMQRRTETDENSRAVYKKIKY